MKIEIALLVIELADHRRPREIWPRLNTTAAGLLPPDGRGPRLYHQPMLWPARAAPVRAVMRDAICPSAVSAFCRFSIRSGRRFAISGPPQVRASAVQ